jgi:hypothetical protein
MSEVTAAKNRARAAKWATDNPERYKATHHAWYLRNRERILQKTKRYSQEHPEQRRATRRRWRKNHPDRSAAQVRRKRARVRDIALRRIAGGVPRCAGCGCTDVRLLEVNHKNGGGRTEHRKLGAGVLVRLVARGKRAIDDLDLRCKVCNALHAIGLKFPGAEEEFTVTWAHRLAEAMP